MRKGVDRLSGCMYIVVIKIAHNLISNNQETGRGDAVSRGFVPDYGVW